MPVVTVRMDEELVRRVEELAKSQGITRSALIKQSLREAVERRFASHVREATLALRQGRKPGKEIDWAKIEKELQETEPQFPTVEEALAYSRKRPTPMK
jgi:Arc/MetJ-type ribon-helix-helix transcriptional regulator